jgi:transcriptional regulator with PAS, ATPase and Fis domain
MSGPDALHKLIGQSAVIQRVREQITRLAPSPVPILILGETGTGKELVAEAIAALSGRKPFVPVNCAALPESLIESELFGTDRGAFTGAVRSRAGLVGTANGGTLFVDELADIPTSVQAKLLRTFESGEYRRLGSTEAFRSEFRILAATNADTDAALATGRLRADLLHRVAGARVWLAPLRKRVEDIPELAQEFLRRYLEKSHSGPARVTAEAVAALMYHEWPGNLRQLRNIVEASAAMAGSDQVIGVQHVAESLMALAPQGAETESVLSLADARRQAERRAVLEALQNARGNRMIAAKQLRISKATLYRLMGKEFPPRLA